METQPPQGSPANDVGCRQPSLYPLLQKVRQGAQTVVIDELPENFSPGFRISPRRGQHQCHGFIVAVHIAMATEYAAL